MSNSYLLKAKTLKNINKDLNLVILLIPVANFRHQSLIVSKVGKDHGCLHPKFQKAWILKHPRHPTNKGPF